MDKEGYRRYLTDRESPVLEGKVREGIFMVERFERFIMKFGKTLETVGSSELNRFSLVLIDEAANTYENYVALLRYGYFVKNMRLYLAVLELLDGAEVMDVLREKLSEMVGDNEHDQVFDEIDGPPLGMPSSEKPRVTKKVVDRMEDILDLETCQKVLAEVAHGLPRDFRKDEREKYLNAGSLDEYLKQTQMDGIAELEKHRNDGTLFYNQEITDEVIEFVKSRPDVLIGERRGNVIYHTKIPFMAKEYLAATDNKMKRYYACHCAWARESILKGDVDISPTFCYCSGGFTKQSWEAALGQPLRVEMINSVLKGDLECSFKVYLPEDVV
ncbi:MAG: hypothetical protein C4K48_02345 [Candidatus Thorarchaeota archaeon]|nr:MAG: hypothetical protein C4K48_02345 [Candidatus Thorarchaeota archaeon]